MLGKKLKTAQPVIPWLRRREFGVIEFREQYPLLPFEETVQIAEALGIRHHLGTRIPKISSSDTRLSIKMPDDQTGSK